MVNVGSLPVEGNRLFDLDTQAGITAVLLAVRGSELTSAQKNEVRDLVFSYTSGGKDQSVRLSLEQKIAAFGLVPIAPPKPKASEVFAHRQEQPIIGSFRSNPSFSVPTPPPVSVPIKTKVPEISVTPVVTPVPEPIPEPVSIPVQVVEAPVVQPTEPEVVVPTVQMPKADQQQYLDRIREIKSLVNEKVGNPVNLVDINNEVGREYMSALLDAMKRINSGMSAESAMQRLEAAYVTVEETLRSVGTHVPEQPAAAPAPVAPPAPEPIVDVVQESEPAPYIPPVQPAYVPPPVQPAQVAPPVYEPVAPAIPHYQSLAESVTPPPVQQYEPVVAQQPVVPTPNYTQSTPAPTVHAATPHTFSSLADMVQQSHAQTGLPVTPAAAQPLTAGDPLLSAEVESGLDQLLSEWSIFKKSGIFGTGPKGREHPLYKKMAELQIPLLLAGRFEGATQEVRQSLTDYMNGWRYEQGLIYEKGETFEHYLRRVIRHILDQNAR